MKDYTRADLEILIAKNDYLLDTAYGMIETAIECYEDKIIDGELDKDFVRDYLLTEINDGFIYIKNDIVK